MFSVTCLTKWSQCYIPVITGIRQKHTDSYSLAPIKGCTRKQREVFLTLGRIIIPRTFISKESKKLLLSI